MPEDFIGHSVVEPHQSVFHGQKLDCRPGLPGNRGTMAHPEESENSTHVGHPKSNSIRPETRQFPMPKATYRSDLLGGGLR